MRVEDLTAACSIVVEADADSLSLYVNENGDAALIVSAGVLTIQLNLANDARIAGKLMRAAEYVREAIGGETK